MRTLALVLLAFAIPFSLAESAATAVAGGSAQDTALRDAAISHNIEAVKAALEKGAHVDAPSSTGRPITPLGAAAMGGWRFTHDRAADLSNNETAKKLAQNGMNDDEIDKYLAVEITNPLLFAAGAKLGPFDRDILFFPISHGNVKLVEILINLGASVTGEIEGYTPPELAKKYDQEPVYKLLVARGGVPVDNRSAAQLALIEAAASADVERMEKAVKDGARINEVQSQQTALVAVLRFPTVDPRWSVAAWWLLDHGADPNLEGEGLPLPTFLFWRMCQNNRMGLPAWKETWRTSPSIASLKVEQKYLAWMTRAKRRFMSLRSMATFAQPKFSLRMAQRSWPRDKQGKAPLDYAESAAMIKLLKNNGAIEQ